jgi:hypothetical protein
MMSARVASHMPRRKFSRVRDLREFAHSIFYSERDPVRRSSVNRRRRSAR